MEKEGSGIGWKSWLGMVLLSTIWGSSFILIKKALVVFPPYQVTTLRLGIAGLVFIPYFFKYAKRIDWSQWKYLLIVSLAGSGIPFFLIPYAQQSVSSSVAGILNSLAPLFTLVLSILFFNEVFHKRRALGILLGFAGAALLIAASGGMGGGSLTAGLLLVLAALFYATSANVVGNKLQGMAPLDITATSFIFIGIPSLIYLLFSDFPTQITSHPEGWKALGLVVILSIVGTVFATLLFFRLVQNTGAVFASTVAYLIPVVAVVFGVLDGEEFSLFYFLSAVLILTGIYLSKGR